MSVKLSISLNEELANLIKKEAQESGRTVSEIFEAAIRAYQREKRRESYSRFAKSKTAKELKLLEKAQLGVIKKLG